MSHDVYGLLIMVGVTSTSILIAVVIATSCLLVHKREKLEQAAKRKVEELKHLRELQDKADARAYELEKMKLREKDAISGTVVSKHRPEVPLSGEYELARIKGTGENGIVTDMEGRILRDNH